MSGEKQGREQTAAWSPRRFAHAGPASPSADPEAAQIGPAALDLHDMLLNAHTTARGNRHLETVLGAGAALCGEYALRAGGPPGLLDQPLAWIFGAPADGILYADARRGLVTIWDIVRGIAWAARSRSGEMPSIEAIVRRNDAQIGQAPYPPLTLPPQHLPRQYALNLPIKLRGDVDRIAFEHDLSPRQTALAVGMATSIVLKGADRAGFDGATLIGEIMVGVSRMKPLERAL